MNTQIIATAQKLPVAIFLVIGAVLLVGFGQGISHKGYSKIRKGMSEKDVEAIVGCPSGNYCLGKGFVLWPGIISGPRYATLDRFRKPGSTRTETSHGDVPGLQGWIGPEIAIWVWFDHKGLVHGKSRLPTSLADKDEVIGIVRLVTKTFSNK